MTRAGCSYFGVRIARHVRRDMADLAARGYTGRAAHVLRERLRVLPRHDGARSSRPRTRVGLTCRRARGASGGRSAARPRAAGSRSTRRSARCSTTGAASPARASTAPLPRLLQGVGRLGARVRRRRGVLGRAGVDGADRTSASTTRARWTCRCERCEERFGGADPGRADARGAGVSRGVGRRLPARGRSRTSPRAAARTRSACCPSTEGNHGISDWNDVASLPGLDDVRDRSVLEALERAGRAVRAPLRAAAARDVRAPRRRGAALAAELRARRRRDPRARGGARRRARGGHRRSLDVGLRGVRKHDAPRDPGLAARSGRR